MHTMPAWVKVAFKYAKQQALEFGFILAFGLMPVWLGAIFQALLSRDAFAYLNGYLSGGEALLLCTATVGPLLFAVIALDFGASPSHRHFPKKGWYSLAIAAVCVVSAGLLGLRAGHSEGLEISGNFLWWMSVILSIASVILWFAVSGTMAARERGAAEIMRQDEHDFVEGFNK